MKFIFFLRIDLKKHFSLQYNFLKNYIILLYEKWFRSLEQYPRPKPVL
jgi:hypothetical protein